jgi:Icc-related predicted phosphoesterase
MKMLVVGDIHGKDKALISTLEYIKKHNPDMLIVCGDITNFGPAEWAKKFLNAIPIKTLVVPGNCDPESVLKTIGETNAINMHGVKKEVGGTLFIGLGGSNPTPFNTPFEFSEEQIYNWLDELTEKDSVLILHAPPRGHADTVAGRGHIGCEAIARIIKKHKPRLVLSAHIHEGRGIENEDGIVFVNPGPAKDGYAAIVTINGKNIYTELLG